MLTRDDIRDHVQPQLEQLADELTDLLWSRLQLQLTEVLETARSALASDLDDNDVVSVPSRRSVPPAPRAAAGGAEGSRAPAAPQKPAPSLTPSGRRPKTCRNCGAVGFMTSSCGKTHNIAGPAIASSPPAPRTQVVEAPPPYSLCPVQQERDRRSEAEDRRPRRTHRTARRSARAACTHAYPN